MEACPKQLFFLKSLLNTFADSTGLSVNYHKSFIVPINVEEEKMKHLASTFYCQVGALPLSWPAIWDKKSDSGGLYASSK